MTLTVFEAGALFLVLFAVFHKLGIVAKTRSVLAFLGVVVIGTAGFLGRALADVGGWGQHAFGSITNWLFGVPVVAGLFIILAIFVGHGWHPKKSAGKSHGFLAMALGALVVAGVQGIPALAGLRGAILSGVAGAVTFVNTVI